MFILAKIEKELSSLRSKDYIWPQTAVETGDVVIKDESGKVLIVSAQAKKVFTLWVRYSQKRNLVQVKIRAQIRSKLATANFKLYRQFMEADARAGILKNLFWLLIIGQAKNQFNPAEGETVAVRKGFVIIKKKDEVKEVVVGLDELSTWLGAAGHA